MEALSITPSVLRLLPPRVAVRWRLIESWCVAMVTWPNLTPRAEVILPGVPRILLLSLISAGTLLESYRFKPLPNCFRERSFMLFCNRVPFRHEIQTCGGSLSGPPAKAVSGSPSEPLRGTRITTGESWQQPASFRLHIGPASHSGGRGARKISQVLPSSLLSKSQCQTWRKGRVWIQTTQARKRITARAQGLLGAWCPQGLEAAVTHTHSP